ncbi:hypothetical protein VP91_00007150 [Candidatus Pelagibacter ubique]|mgnify:FL=1|uniref:Uncharacterized protein n=1 Tax=Pelagibacter ubique TaxID=198252 RepID=A0ABX1T0F1_PELUQ|nr:hypothetical protein [Candidatus Pelagibacter ubique]NMN67571.1 hypothetical protein [Candidatus Pelagibacter ubique]|tara:strand:- start:83 stop:328 length:246 start_codon:yes stop_codon:yes gene_type:complete
MSSEIHKNIENALNKQDVLFNAEVINLTKEKNFNKSELNKIDNQNIWELNDGSNDDQLKTVIGICFMLGSLILMGLYSNLF